MYEKIGVCVCEKKIYSFWNLPFDQMRDEFHSQINETMPKQIDSIEISV